MEPPPEDREFLQRIVRASSKWLGDPNWYKSDGTLGSVIEAQTLGYFAPPAVKYFLQSRFIDKITPETYGVIILRGPRRVGKTATIKYLIKENIDRGLKPAQFIYLSLDEDELFVRNGKRRFLRGLLGEIISEYKQHNEPLFLILDEVSFYEAWARAIKNLLDDGTIGPGVGVIATGSYSLDLSSARRELSGRMGPIGETIGDLFLYPKSYREFIDSVSEQSRRIHFASICGRFPFRRGAIEYLAGYQTDSFGYEKVLQELSSDTLLPSLFDLYARSGGYPKAILEVMKSDMYQGQVKISQARVRQDIYDLIVNDAVKFNVDPLLVEGILSSIEHPIRQLVTNGTFKVQNKTQNEVNAALDYLFASGLFVRLPALKDPSEVSDDQQMVRPSSNEYKFCCADPLSFYSSYTCCRGMDGKVDEFVERYLSSPEKYGFLFESVIAAHISRSTILHLSNRTTGETIRNRTLTIFDEGDEKVDIFSWYVNHQAQFIKIAIECKSGSINKADIGRQAQWLKQNYSIERLIVLTKDSQFEIQQDYALIPAHAFLMLV